MRYIGSVDISFLYQLRRRPAACPRDPEIFHIAGSADKPPGRRRLGANVNTP